MQRVLKIPSVSVLMAATWGFAFISIACTSDGGDLVQSTPCADFDYDKDSYDYGSEYAGGPYGFKGSMCWDLTSSEGTWTDSGDVIHDICLPDENGKNACLHEFYNSDYDLLIVAIAAIDCTACAGEAMDEEKILAKFRQNDWNPLWVTIMSRSLGGQLPTISTAASYKTQYKLSGPVLADTQGTWEKRMFFDKWPSDNRDGVPLTFIVNPLNMLIWDAFSGWIDSTDFEEFSDYILDLSSRCRANDRR